MIRDKIRFLEIGLKKNILLKFLEAISLSEMVTHPISRERNELGMFAPFTIITVVDTTYSIVEIFSRYCPVFNNTMY